MPTKPRKPPPDWESIERHYRAGMISIREIARIHDVSEATIRAHAGKAIPPWERHLADRVREEVRERLARADARADPAHPMSDQQIIAAAATTGVGIVNRSRQSISDTHLVTIELLKRVRKAIDSDHEIERAVEEATEAPIGLEDERERKERLGRRAKLMQAIGLGSHLEQVLQIAGALKQIIPLERVVYGVDDQTVEPVDDPLTELRKQIEGNAIRPDPTNRSPTPT